MTSNKIINIKIQDLVTGLMIQNDTTLVTKAELYSFANKIKANAKKYNFSATVEYSKDKFEEFKVDFDTIFTFNKNRIVLKPGYSVAWLEENLATHMSREQLTLLDFCNDDKEYSI